jgi:RPA family protein
MAQLSLTGTNTLRLQIAGIPGEDNRKAMLNYIMLVQTPTVQAPIGLVSSATVTGPFAPEANATVDATKRTITVPVTGSVRFYQISSGVATPVTGISVASGSVVVSY